MSDIPLVIFIVENDFRGVFVVEKDSRADPVPRDKDGAWIYKIPETGRLKTSVIDPFRDWHDTKATYADGTTLGFAPVGPIPPYRDRSTKVRPISADSKGRFLFLVGTEEELARAMRNLGNLRLGGIDKSRR